VRHRCATGPSRLLGLLTSVCFTPWARLGPGRRPDGHAPVHGPRFDPGNHLDGSYRRNLADVQILIEQLYIWDMDVAISTLRAELSTWIERARSGQEVVVTDRGTPVARLLAVETAPLLDQLIASGVLSKPRRDDRLAARGVARAHASVPVSELVSEQRR